MATLTLGSKSTLTKRGEVAGWPELTGTGDGELWGFFPDAVEPRVAQLDQSTGADLKTFPVPKLQGSPESWAFAHWGGRGWLLRAPRDP